MRPIDLTGLRVGMLLVVEQDAARPRKWRCVCDCGNPFVAEGSRLRSGAADSCGCQTGAKRSAAKTTHGHSADNDSWSPTYSSWAAMKRRCRVSPKNDKVEWYAARGIKVCARWRSFENFLADMGERPAGKTLDRYPDNDGDYRPGNCRWATKQEQAQNRRPRRKRAA